jgi:mRNA interferase MazF
VTPPVLARGDIVSTPFPFADLRGSKVRPALILSLGRIGQDVILAAISSVVRGAAWPTDYLVDVSHPEFPLTGLKVASVVRLHKLASVDASILVSRLGRIGPRLQADIDPLLRAVLGL